MAAGGGEHRGYGVYTISPYATSTQSGMAPYLSRITDGMSERQKVEACVDAVVERLTYQADGGGASWSNGGTVGNCESYSLMLSQLLSMAGIPNVRVSGPVYNGNHGWVQVRIDGQWYIADAVCTDFGYGKVFSFAEHEGIYQYDHSTNDWDPNRVARALIDAAYPG